MPVRTSAHAFIALALVASLVGCRSKAPVVEDPAAQARRQLEEELTSAYSMNAPPVSGIQSFELTAAPTSIQQFDGRLLDVWAYNGTVPGPVLRVRLGEEIEVKLHNRLPQPTTIHWHGVRVPNAMDGVPGVTQEAVAPGASFTYRFTPKDAGTFWFHPHVRTAEQVERGLYGVLIVDDAAPRPYSRDEVWVLDDWRLGPDGQIDPNFVTRHDLAHDGRWGQLVTVNGETSQELIVRPGERIRLRLVNTSNGRVYRPDFSGLDTTPAPGGRVRDRTRQPGGFGYRDSAQCGGAELRDHRPVHAATVCARDGARGGRPRADAALCGGFQPPGAEVEGGHRLTNGRHVCARLAQRRRIRHPVDDQRRGVGGAHSDRAPSRAVETRSVPERLVPPSPDAPSRAVLQSDRQERRARRRALLSRHSAPTPPRDHRRRNSALGLGPMDDALPHPRTRGVRHDDASSRGQERTRTSTGRIPLDP